MGLLFCHESISLHPANLYYHKVIAELKLFPIGLQDFAQIEAPGAFFKIGESFDRSTRTLGE